jgi:hypothetical protein
LGYSAKKKNVDLLKQEYFLLSVYSPGVHCACLPAGRIKKNLSQMVKNSSNGKQAVSTAQEFKMQLSRSPEQIPAKNVGRLKKGYFSQYPAIKSLSQNRGKIETIQNINIEHLS